LPVEQEVKLAFPTIEAARRAVHTAGGRLVVSRRLLDDQLFDTPDLHLRSLGTAVRVRRDGTGAVITWKGPAQPGPVKSREELETGVDDPRVIEAILDTLGLRPCFRSQKFREEYALDGATVTVDETPFGVFAEIEADPVRIERVALALGRSPADYRLESYPTLWQRWCEAQGLTPRDMVFPDGLGGA
jgi:adenylate cyclase, class 2